MKVGHNLINASMQEGILKNSSIQRRSLDSREFSQKVEKINSQNTSDNRVAQIKNEINNGTYKIDIERTSNKMARDLLNL